MKHTKRKGFNFFRSYYDVYNELDDKSKLQFMEALLDRQFLGIKPTELKGMAKFAYISQTNSIDSQVKGYEHKTKTDLRAVSNTPTEGGRQGGCYGGSDTPTLQVEVEVEEKEEIILSKNEIDFDKLLNFIKEKTGRQFQIINKSVKDKYKARLKEGYTKENIINAIINASQDAYHKEQKFKYLTPDYFSRAKSLDLHSFKEIKKKIQHQENPYKGQF